MTKVSEEDVAEGFKITEKDAAEVLPKQGTQGKTEFSNMRYSR